MIDQYFDIGAEAVYDLFRDAEFPWEPLARLKNYLEEFFKANEPTPPADLPEGCIVKGPVLIEQGARIEEGTWIAGPAIVRAGAEVRFGAYVRGNVIVCSGAVVGHDTEAKHAIFLPGAKAGHFAYVGDSILGRNANLGAGTKLGNVKIDMGRKNLRIRVNGEVVDTGMRKMGAILGDEVSLGCNTVTSPGTLIGRRSLGYPLASLSGVIPPNSIIKHKPPLEIVPRRD
jgi:bifunctional UDP-N-acetylglucosamine pyrophosphorylase/glucosamine-1-phosphate N-acetyltransferase